MNANENERIALPKLTGRQKELLAFIKDRWVKLAVAAGVFHGSGGHDRCNGLPGQTGC